MRRLALFTVYGAAGVGIGLVLADAGPYYLTPLRERAHHPDYWRFKSGGSMGHPLGIAGSSMLVLLLLYSVRKRVPALRRAGALGRWLDAHIVLGVVGPLLVVLHSAFKVQGLVALSFWSMVAVAASGFVGRFLYVQIPRTRAGEELSLAEVEALDRSLAERLRVQFGLDQASLERLDALAAPPAGRRGLLRGLAGLLVDDLRLTRSLAAFARERRSVPAPLLADFRRLVRQKAVARRRLLLWDRLHELFHYWHVVHKPFAVVMYVFMAVHVAVAYVTGYGWVGLR